MHLLIHHFNNVMLITLQWHHLKFDY